MSSSDNTSRRLYEQYSKGPNWLFDPERESLATSMQIVHELSVLLSCLDLSAENLAATDFERATGIDAMLRAGDDLRGDAFHAMDSSVGNLLQLVRHLEVYREEKVQPPPLLAADGCPLVPDDKVLFREGSVPPVWMEFFRQLRDAYIEWDDAACQVPTDVTNVVALCYRAYRLVLALHIGLTAVSQAKLPFADQ